MNNTSPNVAIIVLSWNDYAASARCLESLADQPYPNQSIILVDNGSTDSSAERLNREFPMVEVKRNGENLGFSAGMNVGIQTAMEKGADYIWILNNDVIVSDSDTVARLVDTMEANPQLGILSPKVMNYPETKDTWFTQGLVNWSSGNSRHETEVTDASKQDGDLLLNDFVPFCAALFRRDVFEEVGLFPESYFVYREDIEFCGLTIDRGYTIGTNLEVEVYHEESNSSGGDLGLTITYYTARNRWLLRRRMADRTNVHSFFWDYFRWSTRKIVSIIRAGKPRSILAWVRGTFDGIRGESGRGPYP